MKSLELWRVARLCGPKLGLVDVSSDLQDESDLDVKTLCRLWSGMGHIYRVTIQPQQQPHPTSSPISFIVKHVAAPTSQTHPHNAVSLGDQRKADSYQVEANFYERCAPQLLSKGLHLPVPLLMERHAGRRKNELIIAMTHVEHQPMIDLSNEEEPRKAVLTWLATFHAAYWMLEDDDTTIERLGLQRVGTYWHLDTRPEEHQNMPNNTGWQGRLKMAARAIDSWLKRNEFQCIIHGDAKDANILYNNNNNNVCFCDFQYCGKGVPAKDLAYFFCSSSSEWDEKEEAANLEFYLQQLQSKVPNHTTKIPTLHEMHDMMDLAYCDYYRFMCGWGFWGSSGGDKRVRAVLDRLDGGKKLKTENDYDEAVRREYG
jgi:thiamine kinase-like enzyme